MKEQKTNGHRLEDALAMLLNAQASLTAAQGTLATAQANMLSQLADQNGRLARIEEQLRVITGHLIRHEQILEGLPEAIREKIGFKPKA